MDFFENVSNVLFLLYCVDVMSRDFPIFVLVVLGGFRGSRNSNRV